MFRTTAIAAAIAIGAQAGQDFEKNSKKPDTPVGPAETFYAACELQENVGSDSGVTGLLKLYQIGDLRLNIIGKVGGLNSLQKHALHIHAGAVIDGVCESSGAHFNPFETESHGSYKNDEDAKHVGDLKQLRAN